MRVCQSVDLSRVSSFPPSPGPRSGGAPPRLRSPGASIMPSARRQRPRCRRSRTPCPRSRRMKSAQMETGLRLRRRRKSLRRFHFSSSGRATCRWSPSPCKRRTRHSPVRLRASGVPCRPSRTCAVAWPPSPPRAVFGRKPRKGAPTPPSSGPCARRPRPPGKGIDASPPSPPCLVRWVPAPATGTPTLP